jgi:hypothetical protein
MPYSNLRIQLANGVRTDHPDTIIPAVQAHYATFFNTKLADPDPHIPIIDPFIGPRRPLNSPITKREVSRAFRVLQNGRAYGPTTVTGEELKYGGPALSRAYADLFNRVFS